MHTPLLSGSMKGDTGRSFVAKDLELFSTKQNNFFITNVKDNKGIQCRFGMRGVIAEAHYDSGRNMVRYGNAAISRTQNDAYRVIGRNIRTHTHT
jgi:hypothetical protein